VSTDGMTLSLQHSVEVGQRLMLSLPLPRHLRRHSLARVLYPVRGVVRSLRQGPPSRVGVEFLASERVVVSGGSKPMAVDRRRFRRLTLTSVSFVATGKATSATGQGTLAATRFNPPATKRACLRT
jgi:hypothetical protein